jgi:hypothetical protein
MSLRRAVNVVALGGALDLSCGFPREEGHGPTRYPGGAWAAGVVFHLVRRMLGFQADAAAKRLTLNKPRLPPWLDWIEIRGLRVADLPATSG